ncbi:branched-chain amino acid ABC transporter permease [Actinomadura viridis]|uniref:branched-chain amino acid ABC transporter permease n=1 Tax=Actinomadura viridis TaxID=58110 RepID=UPI0036971C84
MSPAPGPERPPRAPWPASPARNALLSPAAREDRLVPPAPGRDSLLPSAAGWCALVLGLAAAYALLTQVSSGHERTVATIFMFIALAQAWNILGGFCGYPIFGQVGFFGLGGYAVAVLMTGPDWPLWAALAGGTAFCAVFACLVGPVLLRLRGHYFAIATIGLAETLRETVVNVPALTGGGAGLAIPTSGSGAAIGELGDEGFAVLFLLLAMAATAVAAVVSGSRFGWRLRAIRQDEDGAAALGVDVSRAKCAAFALFALITGLAGGLYAAQQVVLYPEGMFSLEITLLVIVMVLMGGSGTVAGPVLGAVGGQVLSELLRTVFPQGHILVLALCIIVSVIVFPWGAIGFARLVWRTRRIPLLEAVRTCRL